MNPFFFFSNAKPAIRCACRSRTRVLWILVLSSLILIAASAPAQPALPLELDQPLPVDPAVRIGRLDNGFRYLIRENARPENRASLRLVVDAGSVLEDEDQRGLAHFVEHMAFNGTARFAKQELVDYLESIGMRFGPDLNASTDFDETLYLLQVPTDSAEVVEKAFQILSDWAHAIGFEEEEIEKERGVIIEEWRLGRGAEARMLDEQFPVLFRGSRYAERLPIGKLEVLETFESTALRRFYRDWYRPGLMALIAVGDFDADSIEAKIRTHFTPIPAPDISRPRPLFTVPDHDSVFYAIAADPEATRTLISLYFKMDPQPESTVADYRRMVIEGLCSRMLNARLDERAREAQPPYIYAASYTGRIVRSKSAYVLMARVEETGLENGLNALLTEAFRVKRHGFTATELERTKRRALRQVEIAYNEREKTESSRYASEYTRHMLEDEPIPGIAYEYRFYQQALPGIELEEVNRMIDGWIGDRNGAVLVSAPEKEGLEVPDETALRGIWNRVKNKSIDPYVDRVSVEPLVPQLPAPAQVIEEKLLPDIGVTEWRLSNGIRVALKPTDFKNDQILFTAFSPGGNSLVGNPDYIPALTATSIATLSGVGNFDRNALQKRLADKAASVAPYINTLTEGLSGSASPDDLETLFQLIHLYITAPRFDSTAYLSYKTRISGVIENRSVDPEAAFQDTVRVTLAQHHYRARPWTVALLGEMDLKRSETVYRQRFADMDDFIFIFTGAFSPDSLRPLVCTYLSGMPVSPLDESWTDPGIRPPRGVIQKQVYRGLEAKSRAEIYFTGPFDWSRQRVYELSSMAQVLRIKLREVLREDLGGTYGVRVWASSSLRPSPEYTLGVSFGCDPQRVDSLIAVVHFQIDSLKQFPVQPVYLTKVKETQRREYETDLKENGFWLDRLKNKYWLGRDPDEILNFLELVENLDTEAVRRSANRHFDFDNRIEVVLYPESHPKGGP